MVCKPITTGLNPSPAFLPTRMYQTKSVYFPGVRVGVAPGALIGGSYWRPSPPSPPPASLTGDIEPNLLYSISSRDPINLRGRVGRSMGPISWGKG